MKKRRVVKHERALRDLELRSEYIRQHNPRAALRFVNAAEATIRQLAASPGIGTRYDSDHPALAELRYFPITRFKNDLVFYRLASQASYLSRTKCLAGNASRCLAGNASFCFLARSVRACSQSGSSAADTR